MSIYEALTVLGLTPRSSSFEVKAAYRELVKIWHPDRFGDDERLRRKAEVALREINIAYDVLKHYELEQVTPVVTVRPRAKVRAHPPILEANAAARTVKPRHPAKRFRKRSKLPYLLAGFVAVLIVATIRYSFEQNQDESAATTDVVTAPVVKAPVVSTAPETLNEPKVEKSHAAVSDEPEVSRLSTPAPTVDPPVPVEADAVVPVTSAVKLPNHAVKDLPKYVGVSAADKASIDAACASTNYLLGSNAFVKCVKLQLVHLSHAPAAPDLSGLDFDDRTLIESSCSAETSLKGPTMYRACVIRKLEEKPHAIHLP